MREHNFGESHHERPSIIVPNPTSGLGVTQDKGMRNKANFPARAGSSESRQSPRCCRRGAGSRETKPICPAPAAKTVSPAAAGGQTCETKPILPRARGRASTFWKRSYNELDGQRVSGKQSQFRGTGRRDGSGSRHRMPAAPRTTTPEQSAGIRATNMVSF